MDTQTLPDTVETFRLRGAVLAQGIVFTTAFLAMTIAVVSVAFLDDPTKHGIEANKVVSFVLVLGLFFGGMTLGGIYIVAAYFVECVTFAGASIAVRSVFQNRRFDAADVDMLKWKLAPVGGRVEFQVGNGRTRLDLAGYRLSDRVKLIRRLRAVIPDDRQVNWPMFCHRIALPLRNQCTSRVYEPAELAVRGEVFITRKRYDRVAQWIIPISLVIALAIWRVSASRVGFGVAVSVVFWWLLMRFTTPRQGVPLPRLSATHGGRTIVLCKLTLLAAAIVGYAVRFAGYSRDTACLVLLVLVVPTCPFFIYGLYRADRQRKRQEEAAALLAPRRWDEGMDDAFRPSTGRLVD